MTHPDSQRAKLELNAGLHRYDPRFEPIADAMDNGDAAAWASLPARTIGLASLYRDARAQYRAAVAAGVITDDRSGPSAA